MNFSGSEIDFSARTAGGDQPEHGAERFILFELGGHVCGVAAGAVAEVVHPLTVGSLPNSPDWLLGLAAHRGEPVAVINPAVIAKPALENRGRAKTVVFRGRSNETQFALPIDSLCEMVCAPARLQEYLHNGQPVTFVEHERLFESFYVGQR